MLVLYGTETVKGGPGWKMTPRYTDSRVLIVLASGQGHLSIGKQTYRLRQDVIYICPPGETFGMEAESPEGLDLFLLAYEMYRINHPNREAVRLAEGGGLFPERGEMPVPSSIGPAAVCRTIHQLWTSAECLERYRGQLLFLELLYSATKYSGMAAEDSQSAVERAKAYMKAHYQHNLSIEQLAGLAGLSPKYFVDLFKKVHGVSALDYLTGLRMEQAKQLMAGSGMRLKDIAHQVGYNDEYYFSRKFKKETGVSPTAYIASRRRKIAAYGPGVLGHLLALRIVPYAAPLHPKWTLHYYRAFRSDIPVHLSAYRSNEHWRSNLELLLEGCPDAIICTDDLPAREKEQLERTAPVHYVPQQHACWREQFKGIAAYLGLEEEADKWLREYSLKAEAARERLQREVGGERFVTLSVFKDNCYLYVNRSIMEVLYGDLQLKPAHPLGSDLIKVPITPEELGRCAADRILVNVCQETESIRHWDLLSGSPPFQNLKAVRDNRVYTVPSDPLREYSASAHERLIEELLQLLTGNRPS
ncbi:HTH-type transcriptional activator Btr [Paenibacillus solanacearum]|uniref:HTH-type transcriptional activator Btr n=2 Tax=Paenibacillus solanacearum TaxID=2048548 RepID=A0A916NQL8_9BACL|nr:HTH-type transcriptional activator Btr [Paenibacillus solanacearum]